MSRPEIADLPLESFEDSIHYALGKYRKITDGNMAFNRMKAMKLEETPDKPYLARSESEVSYMGQIIGELVLVVLGPRDTTGAESELIKLADYNTTRYPRDPRFMPIPKTGIYSEVMLTIASLEVVKEVDKPRPKPVIFAGSLDLLGLDEDKVVKIANLGMSPDKFRAQMASGLQAQPLVTYTVGYRQDYNALNAGGDQFGDPNALFNRSTEAIQLCGLIAIKSDSPLHIDALRALDAVEPALLVA